MYIYTWYEYDECFSIPIHSTHQKYLKFTFDDFFQWKCMSAGYGPAMIVFTKISKVPFGHLRTLSHNFLMYEDDSYLQREIYHACLDKISNTIKLLMELGFVIHTDKWVLTPSQWPVFLALLFNQKYDADH